MVSLQNSFPTKRWCYCYQAPILLLDDLQLPRSVYIFIPKFSNHESKCVKVMC